MGCCDLLFKSQHLTVASIEPLMATDESSFNATQFTIPEREIYKKNDLPKSFHNCFEYLNNILSKFQLFTYESVKISVCTLGHVIR